MVLHQYRNAKITVNYGITKFIVKYLSKIKLDRFDTFCPLNDVIILHRTTTQRTMSRQRNHISPFNASESRLIPDSNHQHNVHRGVFAIYFGIIFAFVLFVIKTRYT